VADRLILTKTDLAAPEAAAALRRRLSALNLSAPVLAAAELGAAAERLLLDDIYAGDGRAREIEGWLARSAAADTHDHSEGVQSFCLSFERPLDWTAFGVWLSMLLNRRGDAVLRLKGLLNVVGVATPVLVNGVQHIVHPPSHLEAWPDADRRSRLIFIVRGLERRRIERSLAAFNALVNSAAAVSA